MRQTSDFLNANIYKRIVNNFNYLLPISALERVASQSVNNWIIKISRFKIEATREWLQMHSSPKKVLCIYLN